MNIDPEEISLQDVSNSLTRDQAQTNQKHSNWSLYCAAIISDLLSFTAGVSFGWSSPVLAQLGVDDNLSINHLGRGITAQEGSWIAGLVCLGAIFGPLIGAPTAAKFGRKRTLILTALPFLVSYLILAEGSSIALIYFARFLKGLACGSVFAVLPIYIGEIATDQNRGALGCSVTVFTTAGFLYSYVVGALLTVRYFSLACTIPIVIFLVFFSFCNPETPQYLASIGDYNGLEASLIKLRGTSHKEVQPEIATIRNTIQELAQTRGGIKDLFRVKPLRRALLVSVGLINLQQFSGINPILSYMETIFLSTKTAISPAKSTIIIGLVQFITTIAASFLVEKWGRRVLLLISTLGSTISLALLAIYFNLSEKKYSVDGISWLPLASLFLFIVFVGIGLQPLPWAMMGELFPSSVKAPASTITSLSCFLMATITTVTFPFIAYNYSFSSSFWGFALNCGFGALFIYFKVPETKGKSIQEIQGILAK